MYSCPREFLAADQHDTTAWYALRRPLVGFPRALNPCLDLAPRTLCVVLGNSTATFKQVAGPGALAVTRSSGMGNCSRFVETAGRDFHGVADAFGVGERDEARCA